MAEIEKYVRSYSPWIGGPNDLEWQRLDAALPKFRRPVFAELIEGIDSLAQILSVAGPRRVGKSTLLRHLVQDLIKRQEVSPERIIYYSFDDPALYRPGFSGAQMIEALMEHMAELEKTGPAYLFLDEIQTLDRWELYLKKYYDLKYPVKIVISGSASSPIFRKSRESLLGRIKDHHVLPFSFREFLMYRILDDGSLVAEMEEIRKSGQGIIAMFTKDPANLDTKSVRVERVSDELWPIAESALRDFFVDGGLPEVWEMPTQEEKLDYLFANQVNKVIMEDLVLAVEFRKPEQLKTFYVSLLEQPGREVSMTALSQDIGIGTQQIDKYLPLLETTDLIQSAPKFRKSAVRVRRGHQKFYPVDLALRNAVLRLGTEVLEDPGILGLYAETLVFNTLKKWTGVLQVDYYREKQKEVDFIVHTRPMQYLPVEVKYSSRTGAGKLGGLKKFRDSYRCHVPFLVTRDRNDSGYDDELDLWRFPLIEFLLLFD